MFAFRIGKCIVSKVIAESLKAIWDVLKDLAPPKSDSKYYNYKGQHSIVLMAICDADYCFTLVDIGASGRHSDGGIFKNSIMGQMLEEKTLLLTEPSALNIVGPTLLYVFVGDEAFQLSTYMLRPFPPSRENLTREKRVFNYRLSRARRVIEYVFGILVAKWCIFRKPIYASLETTEKIIQAAVVLHNFLRRKDAHETPHDRIYFPPNLVDSDDNEDGEWRAMLTSNMFDLQNAGSNSHSRDAISIRNNYMHYFVNDGSVPWQWDKTENFNF
ncbi:hypothetical protein NQ314_003533 [Rhamnusium bicolor]|uniref:DDE Tnp4 domain-containing protein n=1 Tax=Rhamnusium bicolor TaxID=1586634 RepID=A0AAV8ZNP7_9CUCU|nr:hypothetical protein NQ314_003533 [Rhamnusium bicolor]